MKILKILLQTSLNNLFLAFLGFLTGVFLARYFQVNDRGIYAALLFAINIFSGISHLSLGQSYVFFQRREPEDFWGRVFFSSIFFILLVASLSYFTFDLFSIEKNFLIIAIILFNSLYLFFLNSSLVQDGLFIYNIARVVYSFSFLLFILILLIFYKDSDVYKVLFSQLLSIAISFLILAKYFFCFNWSGSKLDIYNVISYVKYAMNLHITNMLSLFIVNLDKIIIYYKGSGVELGVYAVVYSLSRMVSIVPDSFSTALISIFSGRQDINKNDKIIFIFRVIAIPSFLFVAILSFLMDLCFTSIYGDLYFEAKRLIPILFFESILGALSWMLAQNFSVDGRPQLVFYRQLISLFPIVIGSFFLDSKDVAYQIAWLLLFSSILRLILSVFFCMKCYSKNFMDFVLNIKDMNLVFNFLKGFINGSK